MIPFGHRLSVYSAAVAAAVLLLMLVPVRTFDHRIFEALNGVYSAPSDHFWLALTTLGDGLVLGILIGAFLVINPRVTVFGLVLLLLASLAVNVLKAVFPTLRPSSVIESIHVVGPLLRSGSFPSGHAASAMAAGLAVALFSSSRIVAGSALAGAVAVGVSRIFVGAHFPSDVLGGMTCALLLFILLTVAAARRIEASVPGQPAWSSTPFQVAFWLEVSTALFVLVLYAPYKSEWPLVAQAAAFAVLAFLGVGYGKRGLREKTGTGNQKD